MDALDKLVDEAIDVLRSSKPGSNASMEAVATISQFYVGFKHAQDPAQKVDLRELQKTLVESGVLERHAETNSDVRAMLRDIEKAQSSRSTGGSSD